LLRVSASSCGASLQALLAEADVAARFHELAGVLLTPDGVKRTKQIEAAVDRCEAWACVDDLVTIVGTQLR
jgi:hypothetical protein